MLAELQSLALGSEPEPAAGACPGLKCFLGLVGGGRRGQESLGSTEAVCSVAAAAAALGVAGGVAACLPCRRALVLCCLPHFLGLPPLPSCLPACLLEGEASPLSSYLDFVRADAVLLHGCVTSLSAQ